jgi:ubiquinol oxidase
MLSRRFITIATRSRSFIPHARNFSSLTLLREDPKPKISVEQEFRKANEIDSGKPLFTEEQVETFYKKNHIPLSQAELRSYGEPYTDVSILDKYQLPRHKEPKDYSEKLAWNVMKFLRIFVHVFFREKYAHHAVVLETVAAVPGMVAGMLRHFRSLRSMQRDHGWIGKLLEEAENERMHLLTWMHICQPTFLERMLVISAQFVYTTFYTTAYLVSPRFCHSMVGYLEEEAVAAYTLFLKSIDDGNIENVAAPDIARNYWNLPADAKLRDVVSAVRADECMHRDYNHKLAHKLKHGVV